MTTVALRLADVSGEGTSFQYYSVLPTDNVELEDGWPSTDLVSIGERLSALGALEPAGEGDLDALACALLAHGAQALPGSVDWKTLANRLSLVYARQLKPGGSRALRMKAGRANFFLRDLLDRDVDGDDGVLAERRFADGFVWDWLPRAAGEIFVDSGRLNAHYHPGGEEAVRESLTLGLPTQMDELCDGRIAVSSCYSDGWYEWTPGTGSHFHAHDCPVVLVFAVAGDGFFLDRRGAVIRTRSREVLVRMPVSAVWRARFVDGKVFVSDWSEPQRITVLDTDGWAVSGIDSGPVLLMNDLCKTGDTYYVLDKMQGRVFSFDRSFTPVGERMSFGKGPGRLYDPITLRLHGEKLHVLSWLTGALSEIRLF